MGLTRPSRREAASTAPARPATNEAASATIAAAFARIESSENHTAATSPRPSDIPYSAPGASLRPAAQRAMSRAAGSASSRATAPSPSGPASSIRTATPRRASSPSSAPSASGAGLTATDSAATDSAAPASASRSRGSTTSALPADGAPAAGSRAARPLQPGQGLLGNRPVSPADEYPLGDGPRGGRDGQQARPRSFGRVDLAHPERRELDAQPDVRLGREHQRYGHACPPSGKAAVNRAKHYTL